MAFPIPKTRDPICLSEVLTEEDLRDSSSLRMALAKGLVILVPDKHAAVFYETTQRDPNEALEKQSDILNRKITNSPEAEERTFVTEEIKPSPAVIQLCVNFRHPDVTDDEIIAQVDSMWSELTTNDLGYISANVARIKVLKWITKKQVAAAVDDETETDLDTNKPPEGSATGKQLEKYLGKDLVSTQKKKAGRPPGKKTT